MEIRKHCKGINIITKPKPTLRKKKNNKQNYPSQYLTYKT